MVWVISLRPQVGQWLINMLPLDCGVGYLPYTTVGSGLCVTSKFWRELSRLDHKQGKDYVLFLSCGMG